MRLNASVYFGFAVMAVIAVLVGMPADALALSLKVGSSFTCVGGSATGLMLEISSCAGTPNFEEGRIFSYFICQFEQLLNETLSEVYCAVLFETTPAVMAALTLLVALAGAGFLTGFLPFTAKELMMLAAKFSLVLVFATQAEYMIGIGYNLFVNMAKEGIVIVLDHLMSIAFSKGDLGSSVGISAINTVDDVYLLFDKTFENIMGLASAGETEGNECQNALLVMMIAMVVVVPPLAAMAAYFVIKLLWMILRAIFGYCQGLLGLTFLVVLSPIYISFALFKPTRTLFDKWVKFLISFAFQMVIVFAFLGMVFYIISQLADDTQSYANLVKPYKQDTIAAPGVFNFTDTCGICKLAETGPGEAPSCAEPVEVLPLSEMNKDEDFMRFMMVKVMAMLVLFYVLDIMLDFVPEMARHLAGPKYAGQLGGGAGGNMAIPGEQGVGKVMAEAGGAYMRSSNAGSGVVNAMQAGVVKGIVGDGGLIDTAIRSSANPNDPFRIDRPEEKPDTSPASNLFGAAAAVTGAAGAAKWMLKDGKIPSRAPAAAAGGAAAAGASGPAAATSYDTDTADGGAAADKPSGQTRSDKLGALQDHASAQPGAAGYNVELANKIINGMKDAVTDHDMGVAFTAATAGASKEEIAAAVSTLISSGRLSAEQADFLRGYST